MKPNQLRNLDQYIPSNENVHQAEITIQEIGKLGKKKNPKFEFIIKTTNAVTKVHFPDGFFPFVIDLLQKISNGNGITVISDNKDFTTQEAAEVLHVSRPYVIKLLENGEIPFHKVGSHRRILAKDLITYKHKMQQASLDAYAELVKMGQEDGGYE